MLPVGIGMQGMGHGGVNDLILYRQGLRLRRRLVPFLPMWRFFVSASSRNVVTGPVRSGD